MPRCKIGAVRGDDRCMRCVYGFLDEFRKSISPNTLLIHAHTPMFISHTDGTTGSLMCHRGEQKDIKSEKEKGLQSRFLAWIKNLSWKSKGRR